MVFSAAPETIKTAVDRIKAVGLVKIWDPGFVGWKHQISVTLVSRNRHTEEFGCCRSTGLEWHGGWQGDADGFHRVRVIP